MCTQKFVEFKIYVLLSKICKILCRGILSVTHFVDNSLSNSSNLRVKCQWIIDVNIEERANTWDGDVVHIIYVLK